MKIYILKFILTVSLFVFLNLTAIQIAYSQRLANKDKNNEFNQFFENKGQLRYDNGNIATDVLFYTSLSNMDIYVTKKSIIYVQKEKSNIENNVKTKLVTDKISYTLTKQRFDLEILNSNQTVKFEGVEKKPTKFNIGGKIVNAYSSIKLSQIYEGVDMVLYIDKLGLGLKYDFIIHPGADYSLLRFKYNGMDLSNREGELLISSNNGKQYVETIPKSYLSDGTPINVSYITYANNEFSYNVPLFDRKEQLTIDPLIQGWATLTGSNDIEVVTDMAYNSVGVYLVGYIEADWTTIPSVVGGSRQYTGDLDALIMNFDNQGTNSTYTTPMRGDLVAVSIFGGTDEDMLTSIDVEHGTNNIIIAGHGFATPTNSFPNSGTTNVIGSFSSNTSKDAFYGYLDNNLNWAYINILGAHSSDAVSKVKHQNGTVFLATNSTDPGTTLPFIPVHPFSSFQTTNINGCLVSYDLNSGAVNWGTFVSSTQNNFIEDLQIVGQEIFILGNIELGNLNLPNTCPIINSRGVGTDGFLVSTDILSGNFNLGKYIVSTSTDSYTIATDIEKIEIDNVNYLLVLGYTYHDGYNLQNIHLSPNQTNNGNITNPDAILLLLNMNLTDVQYYNSQNILKTAGVFIGSSLFDYSKDLEVDELHDFIFLTGVTNSQDIYGINGRISSTVSTQNALSPPADGFISVFKLKSPNANSSEWNFEMQYTNYIGGLGEERDCTIELEFNSQTNFSDVYISGYISNGANSSPTLDPPPTNMNQTSGSAIEVFLIKCCLSPPNPELTSGNLLLCYKTDFQDYYEVKDNILTSNFSWTSSCPGVRIINNSGKNRRVQIIFENTFLGVCTVYVKAHNSCGDSHPVPIIIERKIIPDIDFTQEGPFCMGQGAGTWLNLDPALNIFVLNSAPFYPYSNLELIKDGTSLGLISNLNNGSIISSSQCSLYITSPGVYKLKTFDLCGNVIYSKEVAVRADMDPSFDLLTYSNGYVFTSNTTIDNSVYPGFYMGKELRITSGNTLTIKDVSLQFAQCAYILVEADAHLIIDNSSLYSCDWWTGIIPDWATNVLGNRNITITNSTISDAECAIGLVNEVQINLNNNNFINNYWHVGTLKPFLWFGSGFSNIQLPKDVRSCDPDAYVTNYPGFTNNASMPAGNCNIINNVFQNNKSFKNTHYKSINGDGIPILSDGCSYCLELGVDYVFISAFMLVQENNISFQVNNNSFSNTWNEDFLIDLSFNDSHNSIDLNDNIFVSNDINSINANTLYSMYFVRSNIIHASNNIFSGKYSEILNVIETDYTNFVNNKFSSTHLNSIGGTIDARFSSIEGCEFNGLDKGLRLINGPKVVAPIGTNYQVFNNTFRNNKKALIISPVQDPFIFSSSQDPFQTYPVELKCNKFKQNDIAIAGSGSINTQSFSMPGLTYEWGNDFNGNIDWDILWEGGYSFEYFHGCSTVNETTLNNLNQMPYIMNGSLVTNSNTTEYLNFADDVDYCTSVWKMQPSPSTQDSIEHSTANSIILSYPNPFNDELIVSTLSDLMSLNITLYDMLGREVYSERLNKSSKSQIHTINTSKLISGVYILKIKTTKETVSLKVIKN